ncbi:MAG: D-alanine--poly(phosphoribitol) ligase subunit 2 [Pirellulaceae bacterium]|jgi:D-alanine--poly(phosphoribitol) ligase subunit 2
MAHTSALIEYFQSKHQLAGTLQLNTPLFSSGAVDSMGMLDLIIHLEQKVGIKIAPAEVTVGNLDSIARIDEFVNRKMAL